MHKSLDFDLQKHGIALLNSNVKQILCPPKKNAVRCESKGEKAISKSSEK